MLQYGINREQVGAQAQKGICGIRSTELFKGFGGPGVVHDGENGMILGGPGMVSEVGFSAFASPSANLLPHGISGLAESLQELRYLLIICLIISYKQCFHTIYFIFACVLYGGHGAR